MSYDHRKQTSFNLTSTTFLPDDASSSSRLAVKLDFSLKTDKVILVEGRDSGAPLFLQNFPPSYRRAFASAAVRGRDPTGFTLLHDMLDAVDEAIGDAVDEEALKDMVAEAWMEVITQSFLGKHGVVRVGLEVLIKNWHVYTVGFGGGGDASSVVPMVEKYEVREGEEKEKGCSICLEEIGGGGGGGGALRMPCLHVFHGDCISEWLRKRRSCPLCRYEMPMGPVPSKTRPIY